ncbi:MAG TPA: hypothetical protein VLL73_02620, partial [Desulfurivibrionaceae bacterium]|nr:hypothetical protein [Desulfurivibrionaceae bacterium]
LFRKYPRSRRTIPYRNEPTLASSAEMPQREKTNRFFLNGNSDSRTLYGSLPFVNKKQNEKWPPPKRDFSRF